MSKKMMKRSLALGALMAFVITGNALAAEQIINSSVTNVDKTVNITSSTEAVNASNNTLTITTGAGINVGSLYHVYVDCDQSITETNNSIIINGGTTKASTIIRAADARGKGVGTTVSANENKIIIIGSDTIVETRSLNTAYAGGLMSKTEAKNNIIEIKDGANVEGNDNASSITAGGAAVVESNKVLITGGAKANSIWRIYGGYTDSEDGQANYNIVEISDGAKVEAEEILGGFGLLNASSSEVVIPKATMNGNKVVIKDATVTSKGIYGVWSDSFSRYGNTANLSGNEVNISGNSTVNANIICGAYVKNDTLYYEVEGNTTSVTNNSVIIDGTGTVDAKNGIYGAYASSTGAGKNSATAQGNTVKISGDVTVTSDTPIYGGYAEALPKVLDLGEFGKEIDDTSTAEKTETSATGNTVEISGNAKVETTVYGGYASSYKNDDAEKTSAVASGNTIVVSENADISGAVLVGSKTETVEEMKLEMTSVDWNTGEGIVQVENTADTSAENTSNNTLSISKDWTGGEGGKKEVKTLGNFDEIVIEEMQYGETALTVTGELNYKKDIAGNENSNGTKITVKRINMSGSEDVSNGVNLNIIATGTGVQTQGAVGDGSSATIYKGTSEIIDVTFNNSDLTGTNGGIQVDENNITKKTRNDQVLVIGESRAAATAFVNQGSEIIETGLDALARDNAKAGDTKAFAAVYGNASEYATGSHVKVNGWSGIVGVGKTNANGLTVGAFFENGEGNYRTYNTVGNDFMRGDGEANYNGGGFLVRKDNPNGVYTEASLRAGNLQNELRKAVRGHDGLAGYDVDTFYYGAHVGVGKIIPRGNEGDSIDVYGKFIYTHHDSESFDIDGSDFHFDSVDSERLRLGFRINEVQTNKLSMYYGAAWEYEFGGDADNTTVGYDLSTPSLGGSTVIGEIGMHYLASEKWSLDLNVRGYSGERDGFSGSVQANYNF